MKKAVAIPYVIALIMGVIAIGILAYWLISQSSKTTTGGLEAECQAKLFSFCVQWQTSGGTLKPSEFKNWGSCSVISDSDAETKCKTLGITK